MKGDEIKMSMVANETELWKERHKRVKEYAEELEESLKIEEHDCDYYHAKLLEYSNATFFERLKYLVRGRL